MILFASFLLSAWPQPCLTDAEIEAALGPQIRAGVPVVRTSGLRNAPLCSAKTLAQRIQEMRREAFPEPKPEPAREERGFAIEVEAVPSPPALRPAAPRAVPSAVTRKATPIARFPAKAPAKRAPATSRPSARGQGASYYPNCAAVRAAGRAPIRRGQPGYSRKLDRDGDGIGCE